jgi:hypothetical protein
MKEGGGHNEREQSKYNGKTNVFGLQNHSIGSIELSYSSIPALYFTENSYNRLRLLLSHAIMAATVGNNKRQ